MSIGLWGQVGAGGFASVVEAVLCGGVRAAAGGGGGCGFQ